MNRNDDLAEEFPFPYSKHSRRYLHNQLPSIILGSFLTIHTFTIINIWRKVIFQFKVRKF